ncbi:MAG: DUF1844 domain-containing protein [Myxococcales bacterium]|jgi:hypothetical protein
MAEQENKGFKVIDRRVSAENVAERPAEKPAEQPSETPEAANAPEHVEGPGWKMREEKEQKPLPQMDFTTFCLSLASSAMIHLGDAPHPETGKAEANMPLAKQTIDILALLEDKTRGNLTSEESRLLATLLYDLRIRYVEAQRTGSRG